MTSTTRVNMNICDKITLVEATAKGDGTYDIKVTSTCDNVNEFAEGLENLSMSDLVDKANSKVFDRMRVTKMSANCLVPAGILSAAWIEAGLVSTSRAKKEKENSIEFVFD